MRKFLTSEDNLITCLICKKQLKSVSTNHLKTHKISLDAYCLRFSIPCTQSLISRSVRVALQSATRQRHREGRLEKVKINHPRSSKGIRNFSGLVNSITAKNMWAEKTFEERSRILSSRLRKSWENPTDSRLGTLKNLDRTGAVAWNRGRRKYPDGEDPSKDKYVLFMYRIFKKLEALE